MTLTSPRPARTPRNTVSSSSSRSCSITRRAGHAPHPRRACRRQMRRGPADPAWGLAQELVQHVTVGGVALDVAARLQRLHERVGAALGQRQDGDEVLQGHRLFTAKQQLEDIEHAGRRFHAIVHLYEPGSAMETRVARTPRAPQPNRCGLSGRVAAAGEFLDTILEEIRVLQAVPAQHRQQSGAGFAVSLTGYSPNTPGDFPHFPLVIRQSRGSPARGISDISYIPASESADLACGAASMTGQIWYFFAPHWK